MPADPNAKGSRRYLRIGKYEVREHIAAGGMGAVYRAVDADLGREVALKVLSSDLAAQPIRLERFRREARHGAKLRHENIVTVYEFGESDGTYYLALEFVEGESLYDYIVHKGPLQPEETRPLMIQAARALEHIHKHGLVHRDVKPSNILLAFEEGHPVVKLTDLGLAREASSDEFRMTREGTTVGSVDYMAPEQARDSGKADIRSDLYSLGCTWFHLLAGHPPFAEGGLTERLIKHLEAEPPDIRQYNPKVPPGLSAILKRLLAKKPDDRFQTPSDLLRALTLADWQPVHSSTRPTSSGPDVPASQIATAEIRRPGFEAPERGSRSRRGIEAFPTASSQPTVAGRAGATLAGTPDAVETDTPVLPPLSDKEQREAADKFTRANRAIVRHEYKEAAKLLFRCAAVDPANLTYRLALRRLAKTIAKEGPKPGWSRWMGAVTSKTKLKAAQVRRDHRRVLECGEEALLGNPTDATVQLDMAEAARKLGIGSLAVWILEQAWLNDPGNRELRRSLAQLYERRGQFGQAIAVWKSLSKDDPSDTEARQKAKDLSATETIARGRYGQEVGRRAEE